MKRQNWRKYWKIWRKVFDKAVQYEDRSAGVVYFYLFFNLYKSIAFINAKILILSTSSGECVYPWRVCVFGGGLGERG